MPALGAELDDAARGGRGHSHVSSLAETLVAFVTIALSSAEVSASASKRKRHTIDPTKESTFVTRTLTVATTPAARGTAQRSAFPESSAAAGSTVTAAEAE